jgi:hypothetical protein
VGSILLLGVARNDYTLRSEDIVKRRGQELYSIDYQSLESGKNILSFVYHGYHGYHVLVLSQIVTCLDAASPLLAPSVSGPFSS